MYMERHGLRVFCLRIGAVRAYDDPTSPTANPLIDLDAEGRRNRLRAVWLSRRDCAELIASCLDVEDVSWAVVYGVSGNPRRFWDSPRPELLGWERMVLRRRELLRRISPTSSAAARRRTRSRAGLRTRPGARGRGLQLRGHASDGRRSDDEGLDRLAADLVRDPDHRRKRHRRVADKALLDLPRADPVACTRDQVVRAADEAE